MLFDIAETVAEAKQLFDIKKHQTVLIDWNFPDGEGLEIAEYIRDISKDIAIIFLSGVFTADRIEKAQTFSPKACLEKDYSEAHIQFILKLLEETSGAYAEIN